MTTQKIEMSWAYSNNEEFYDGSYDSKQEAIDEGLASGGVFWVGECVPPIQPEMCWTVEDWLDQVAVEEDYSNEWGEDWDRSTKEQRVELEESVRKVIAEWLDRYMLRPRFFNVVNVEKHGGA